MYASYNIVVDSAFIIQVSQYILWPACYGDFLNQNKLLTPTRFLDQRSFQLGHRLGTSELFFCIRLGSKYSPGQVSKLALLFSSVWRKQWDFLVYALELRSHWVWYPIIMPMTTKTSISKKLLFKTQSTHHWDRAPQIANLYPKSHSGDYLFWVPDIQVEQYAIRSVPGNLFLDYV